jgi:excinuclease ABC subunit A
VGESVISVIGARVHNLQNINVDIPRNKLVVITGLSGSGKSSLAFDTIYAEGQRRYLETMSAYARQFLGGLERPDVDQITGLSPVVAIEQKTTSKNPRSTVGTITEVYDFFRLLYARAGEAYSYETGEKMVRYNDNQIVDLIIDSYEGKAVHLFAPVVRNRKGHYKELFEQIIRKGFLYARVDGKVEELTYNKRVDRYKNHNIEILIDKLVIREADRERIKKSVLTGLKHGDGIVMVGEPDDKMPRFFSKKLMCPTTGVSYNTPAPHSFSFNSPRGACNHCNGLGTVAEIDIEKLIPDNRKSIKKGGIELLGSYKNSIIFWQVEALLKKRGFNIETPLRDIPEELIAEILYGTDEPFRLEKTPLGTSSNYVLSFNGIIEYINNHLESFSKKTAGIIEKYQKSVTCPVCNGSRLNKEALHFKLADKNISEISNMDISELREWTESLPDYLNQKQVQIAGEVLKEINKRLGFLSEVGLDYLSLNRPSGTLSGGEAQRIRLATQIGAMLVNVLYILDEPSIGLHPRDNKKLIESLIHLRDIGNSVIVVEHDEEIMRMSDYIIDLGPGAGRHGGNIVAEGNLEAILESDSLTSKYLSGKLKIPYPSEKRKGNGKTIKIKGAKGNNLKNVDVEFPLGTMICVTGVSGSGKSTLINETLYPVLSKMLYNSTKEPMPYKEIKGLENIDKVIDVDQSAIGRTPRSNPSTYTGIFTDIRKLFEQLPESKIRGYNAGRFSFNVKGGRCEECKGAGVQIIEMNFLPDVYVECKACRGKRYNRETLEVKYRGKSINDVLNMTVNQAAEFFENIPVLKNKLEAIRQVGLGYVHLGQPSTTLSGGEAQRVKLASELTRKDTGKTLYIFDEPTTGLHFDDIKVLLEVLDKLVEKGNTVIIIEHNADVIKYSDYIIDLGPEGGRFGGEIIFQGYADKLKNCNNSYTAKALFN